MKSISFLSTTLGILLLASCDHHHSDVPASAPGDSTLIDHAYEVQGRVSGDLDTTDLYSFQYDAARRFTKVTRLHIAADSINNLEIVSNYHYQGADPNPYMLTGTFRYPGEPDRIDTTFYIYQEGM